MNKAELEQRLDEVDQKVKDISEILRKRSGGLSGIMGLLGGIDGDEGKLIKELNDKFSNAIVGMADESLILVFSMYGKYQVLKEYTGFEKLSFDTVMQQTDKMTSGLKKE